MDDTPDFNTNVHNNQVPEGGHYGTMPEYHACLSCGYDFNDPRCTCGYSINHDVVVNGICTNCNFDFASGHCWCGGTSINQNREPIDLQPGDNFPSQPQPLDVYTYGDYTYVYSAYYHGYPGNRYTSSYGGTFADSNKEE